MKKRIQLLLVSVFIVLFIVSCSEKHGECVYEPDLSDIKINLSFERLDNELLNVNSRAELRGFLQAHPIITEYFLKREQYPDDSVMMESLFHRFQNPHIDTLKSEIDRVFGDLTDLKTDFTQAFSHLKYYYPELKLPKVEFVATGLDNDLFVTDSLIIVGLDYYLGDGAKYRPIGLYQYMLDRYRPQYIVPSIMLLYGISPEYNKTDLSDKTILADMIGYGKSFYFAKHMMPCTPDSVLIWYSREEIEGVRNNQDIIYAHFLENELLYETNHMLKKKYIEERPKTIEIGEKAPGRIATWLGWEIVRQYMEKNDDVTLTGLMANPSARKIFDAAHYRPEKR